MSHPAFTPSHRASPHFDWCSFPIPQRTRGWVGLDVWFHTEVVYPTEGTPIPVLTRRVTVCQSPASHYLHALAVGMFVHCAVAGVSVLKNFCGVCACLWWKLVQFYGVNTSYVVCLLVSLIQGLIKVPAIIVYWHFRNSWKCIVYRGVFVKFNSQQLCIFRLYGVWRCTSIIIVLCRTVLYCVVAICSYSVLLIKST